MYHAEIVNRGDSRFEVKTASYKFVVDTEGQGVTPPDALLASLGSCIGVYMRKYCEGAKIPLPEFTISLDAELTADSPHRFQEIAVTINAHGLILDERRKKAMLEFVHNCPVHNTLKANPAVEIRIG